MWIIINWFPKPITRDINPTFFLRDHGLPEICDEWPTRIDSKSQIIYLQMDLIPDHRSSSLQLKFTVTFNLCCYVIKPPFSDDVFAVELKKYFRLCKFLSTQRNVIYIVFKFSNFCYLQGLFNYNKGLLVSSMYATSFSRVTVVRHSYWIHDFSTPNEMLNKSRLFKSSRMVSTTEICSIYRQNNKASLCLMEIRMPISDTMYHDTISSTKNA